MYDEEYDSSWSAIIPVWTRRKPRVRRNATFVFLGILIAACGAECSHPPAADAGPDQTVIDSNGDGSESVDIDGSSSTGTIVGYSWSEGENGVGTGAKPEVVLDVGVHTITLTVTNDTGLTAADDVKITVNEYDDSVSKAGRFLRTVMDQYHGEWFDVYTELGAAGNHFVHGAAISGGTAASNLITDDSCSPHSHRGGTCIKNSFLGRNLDWGGFYRMNGVLKGSDVSPQANWGTEQNAGINLTGASELEFWVRGEQGNERVEFFTFGVGRDSSSGSPIEPHPDSSPKLSTGYVTLTQDWQRFSIPLSGVDLR